MNTVKIENRKARYDFFIEDKIECGIVLSGNEIKSIREGSCSLSGSFALIENHEVFLQDCFIKKYKTANDFDIVEKRSKKLLLHKSEILNLEKKITISGYTLIPLEIYFTNKNKCKCLLGLCKGRKNYDKRDYLKDREIKKTIKNEA